MNVALTTDGEAELSGTVTVTATVSPSNQAESPVRCQFYVDGVYSGTTDTSYPLTFAWDTTQVTDGAHVLRADVLVKNRLRAVALNVAVLNNPPAGPLPVIEPPPVLMEIEE